MSDRCNVCNREIGNDDRMIGCGLVIRWGARDLRDDFAKAVRCCSFGCLAAWATGMRDSHDGHVLVEGNPAATGDTPAVTAAVDSVLR